MRLKWMKALSGVLALLCFSTVCAQTAQNKTTKVLETFSAGAYKYQLAVEPCAKKKYC